MGVVVHNLIVVFALAGCAQVGQSTVEQISPTPAVSSVPEEVQQAAKQVAFRAVETAFPHVNPAPVSKCVGDHASNGELLTLADGMLHSTTPAELAIVTAILQKPNTQLCVAGSGQVLNP